MSNPGLAQASVSSNFSGSNDFVKKLFQMLQEDDYKDVVKWTATGDSFVVLNTNDFTKEILPRHFKHSNFASFVRQLNKYDFHKVKVSNEEKSSYPYGEDAWEFRHPDFRINDRDSLENIKRKGPSNKKAPGLSSSTNGSEPSNSIANSSQSINDISTSQQSMREQIEYLQSDNKALHSELGVLRTKYNTIIESIVAMNNIDERYHRSLNTLVSCLVQAGFKLPPLDFPNPSFVSLQLPNRANSNSGMLSQPVTTQQVASQPGEPALDHLSSITSPQIPIQAPAASQTAAPGAAPGAAPLPSSYLHSQPPLKPTPPSDNITPKPHSPLANSGAGSPAIPGQLPQIFTTNLANPKFHVLLVEDDNVCIQLCRKFLVKYGCQVTVATDGLNAISTVEHTKYDLVLMDIVMPNLDGATATSVIRSFDTKTPIIAMTGNIEENDLVNYLQNGMSDILAKPFTKDDLYSILAKHLLTDETKGEIVDPSSSVPKTAVTAPPAVSRTVSEANLAIKQEPGVVSKKQRLS